MNRDHGPNPGPYLEFQLLEESVVLLASIRAELDYLLSDQDAIIRSHVKRAFRHLDRSLVADSEIRQKWLKAFDEGETACEAGCGASALAWNMGLQSSFSQTTYRPCPRKYTGGRR